MEVAKAGWAHTLLYDGDPLEVIFSTRIRNTSHRKGKQYIHLDVPDHLGSVFTDIDQFIQQHQPTDFSPWLRGAHLLVCKVHESVSLPPIDKPITVKLRFGNFSSFGYCWLAIRIHEE